MCASVGRRGARMRLPVIHDEGARPRSSGVAFFHEAFREGSPEGTGRTAAQATALVAATAVIKIGEARSEFVISDSYPIAIRYL